VLQQQSRVGVVDDIQEVAALTHPVRIAALAALRSPDSAASVARAIGQSRQLVNYHLKELERAGLIVPAGERRKGNFVEQLYRAVASTFVVSPRLAWSGADRERALRDQASLEHLIVVGERLQRGATALLDRAAFDGEEIASAVVEGEIRLTDEAARSAFMTEYLAMLGPLLKKHGAKRGPRYRVVIAVHPDHEEDT
jgi:DNA-binding transcriptional ArsR family regulator